MNEVEIAVNEVEIAVSEIEIAMNEVEIAVTLLGHPTILCLIWLLCLLRGIMSSNSRPANCRRNFCILDLYFPFIVFSFQNLVNLS